MEMLGEAGGGGSTPNPTRVANFAAAAMDLGLGGVLPTSVKGKKRKVPYSVVHPPKTPNPIPRSNSAATAETLLNMSNDRRISATTLGPSISTPATTSFTTTTTTAYPSQQHGFTMAANDTSILGDAPTTTSSASSSAYGYGFANSPSGKSIVGGGISIAAPPTHDDLVQRGKYPEPSPAACGKRKLAEIAAAQMLAGVGATSRRLVMNDPSYDTTKGRSATPPPSPPNDEETNYMNTPGAVGSTAALTSSSSSHNKAHHGSLIGHGGSLQILNPDTFGDRTIRRTLSGMSGSASPHTPWDGQLAALVRYV